MVVCLVFIYLSYFYAPLNEALTGCEAALLTTEPTCRRPKWQDVAFMAHKKFCFVGV